jgi:MFS family permease
MTYVRYRVLGFAVLLATITYLDRVCISTLAPFIMKDLGLSEIQMSYVFSAFTLAYGAFEIPTAWWADRVGTRTVLTRIVAWWSSFTILTSMVWSYASLLTIRFLFGVGEAGAWPCVARTFSRWIPSKERGRVQGVFFMGAHLAGGVTPILVTWLLMLLPWRWVFVVFGLTGFVWATAWYLWFRDEPRQHASVSAAERELIESGRAEEAPHATDWAYWKKLFLHPNIWPLCVMYFGNTYAFYFCITWFPRYLEKGRGFKLGSTEAGLLAGLPLLASVLGDLTGGWATDHLTRRFGPKIGRTGLGAAAYLLAALAMGAGAATPSALGAVVLIAIAVALVMFTLGAAWSTCIDIGGTHSGVVSAAMNTAGQVGGFLSPIVLAYLVDRTGSWNTPVYVISGVFAAGTVAWLLVDPRKRIFE